jgi:hypothetical protein
MRRSRKRLTAAVATLALAGGLSAGLAGPAGAQAEGDATGVAATLSTLLINVGVPPTPFVAAPPSGSDSIVNANIPFVAQASVLAVESTVNGSTVNSEASAANASLINGVPGVPSPVLGAEALSSECSGDENGTTGEADVLNLVGFGGLVNVPVSVPPNTAITIPMVGSLVLNEQNQTASGITVRSLHLTLNVLGVIGADVIVAESACFPGGREADGGDGDGDGDGTGPAGTTGTTAETAAIATAANAVSGTPNLTG